MKRLFLHLPSSSMPSSSLFSPVLVSMFLSNFITSNREKKKTKRMIVSGSSLMYHNQQYCLNLGLGFCRSCNIVRLSSIMAKRRRFSSVNCTLSSNQRLEQQIASSEQGDDHELTYEGLSLLAGGIVALGKFDALHVGHRELAIQASKIGTPYLLSFSRMAEVLGWEPRPPIVAKSDRGRVLSSWAPYCGNVIPLEFQVEFSSVRHLTPRQFVEKLSKELGVHGVVAGENYRFGYKAAGDASELVRLCEEFGIGAYIIDSVMDKKLNLRNLEPNNLKERGQVSSTRVRQALALGDMNYVSELLGRQHRLVLVVKDQDRLLNGNHKMVSFPKSYLLNLPPGGGFYKNCSVFIGNEHIGSLGVLIDSTHIHLEMGELGSCIYDSSRELQLLGIEFGNLES